TPAGLREVELRMMEGDRLRDKQIMSTELDGRLSLKYELKDNFDGRDMRVEIRNLHKNDGNQRLSVPLTVSRDQAIDLQFLPEGGHMVAGLKSVVGFKALGEDGKGIQVEGEIINSKGKKVSAFSSFYKGIGSFDFTPEAGEVYTARLMLKGALKNYPLPLAKPAGTVINVRNPEEGDSIHVSISASEKVFNSADSWYLTALSGGRITYMEPMNPSTLIHVISKKQFPSGLTRFTLLKNKVPLNERLVFVDHLDRLQIAMETHKPNYYKRDSVSLAIYVKDAEGQPVKGNFSLAVTDDTQVRADSTGNNDIRTTLLLTTELKGKIETPGYYLSRKDEECWKALDYLMLTQGWTNYEWADIFNRPEPPAFEPELKLEVSGTVTNIFNKPIRGAQMLISSQKPAFLASTLSDTSGRYMFDDLPEIDSGSFFIQARTPKGRSMNFGEVRVESFKPPTIKTSYRDQIAPWYVDTDPVQLNYVKNVINAGDETRLRNSGIALKEVRIRSKKVIKGAYKVFREPDMVFDEQDIKESAAMSLYQILRQKLPGFKVVSEEGMPTAKFNKYVVDIFADGNAIPIRMNSNFNVAELLQQLNSTMVASFVGIAVYYSKQGGVRVKGASAKPNLQAIHNQQHELRSRGSDYYLHARTVLAETSARQYEFATIHITTKFRTGGIYNNKPDFATLRPLPVMHPQEFYSPKYGTAENADKADYRATVYWAPDIVTDSQGRATVSFYTADIPGTYTLNIQGSDMKGSLGSGSSKLKIITQAK
ncbi:MAG: carboxypeptidase regulatory-like domain-containing protein, partial [Pedobacter sp.]